MLPLRLNDPPPTVTVNAPEATETPPLLNAAVPLIVPLMPELLIVSAADALLNDVEPKLAATFDAVTAITVCPLESCA